MATDPTVDGQRPPGPDGWPGIGVTGELARDRLGYITQTARTYGDVVLLPVAGADFYALFHPDRIGEYARFMTDYTERAIETWTDRTVRNVHRDMMELTLEIVNSSRSSSGRPCRFIGFNRSSTGRVGHSNRPAIASTLSMSVAVKDQ